ncbi:uroporphyrinogen decarboxylase family protein [Candidatus Latescibacterota bacterium]
MTPQERVLAACAFQKPDKIPRFENFWEYPESWEQALGEKAGLTDVVIWYPDETPFPAKARTLKEEDGSIYEIDSWGRTIRKKKDAYFVETIEAPFSDTTDIDSVIFESPTLDQRYLTGRMDPSETFGSPNEAESELLKDKAQHCVFGKTGGPYLRATYLRGETEFLMDIAEDPGRARAIADKIVDHMIRVGLEQLKRWRLHDNGMWIFDDMGFNHGTMFSPVQFESVFLPAYRRMVKAYKDAGAQYVFLHSDGDVSLLLDMLTDAGIDGLHPLERRANMDITAIRKRYSDLILAGGMCNTRTLINGSPSDIESEAREIIELGKDGGVIIGSHSLCPEIPLENFRIYHETCLKYGTF